MQLTKKYEDVGLELGCFVRNFIIIECFIVLGLLLSLIKYQTTFSLLNFGYKILITLLYVAVAFMLNKEAIMDFIVRKKKQFWKNT